MNKGSCEYSLMMPEALNTADFGKRQDLVMPTIGMILGLFDYRYPYIQV